MLTLDPLAAVREKDARIRQTQDRIREKIAADHPRKKELKAKLDRLEEDRQLLQHLDGVQSIIKERRERDMARTKKEGDVVVVPDAGHARLGR